jgi:hypothetical protein
MSTFSSKALPTGGSQYLNVLKLDKTASNWATWHIKIETAFKARGLMDFVDGSEP